jgi:hypothetical protein
METTQTNGIYRSKAGSLTTHLLAKDVIPHGTTNASFREKENNPVKYSNLQDPTVKTHTTINKNCEF